MTDRTMIMLNVPFRLVQKNMAALKAPESVSKNMYEDPSDAMAQTEEIAATGAICEGIHSHNEDGTTMWMPCSNHEQYLEAIGDQDSYHDEEDGYGMKPKKYESINFKPTSPMAAEAKRGLDWREEFNRGGTQVGVARARDISNRSTLSPSTVKRMVSYFARHTVDKKAEGFRPGEDGYPSAGRIAWALWGGDAGESWANARKRSMDSEDNKKDFNKDMDDSELGEGVLIEGPVSSGVTDRDGDVVDPDAVMRAWDGYKKNPIILHNHERGGIGKMISVTMGDWPGLDHKVPIGRALIDGHEKDICRKVRKGIIRAFSIGFIAKDDGLERMADEEGRISHRFTDIDWVETSVVDIPSNPMALFDVVKQAIKVQTKGAAPDSFNNPFSMWIVRTGETMTDAETTNEEVIEETLVETPMNEEPLEIKESTEITTTEEEVTEEVQDSEEEVTEMESVSGEQFKALQDKVDAVIDAVLALKDMNPDPTPVVEETDEIAAMKSELDTLRSEKAAAEVEARIAAEVESRVKSIIGDTPIPNTECPIS